MYLCSQIDKVMTREEAKRIALEEIDKDIEKNGEDALFCAAPMPGKNSWTLKEARESVVNDVVLEGTGMNIIDSIIDLEEYFNK